jgi:hypothetical protein
MLTAAQKARCAKIAAALDRGDMATWKRVEPFLSPEERGQVWEERAGTKAMAEKRRLREAAARPAGVGTKSLPVDLDFWGSDDGGDTPDDDDEEDGDDGVPCMACHGTGRDEAGNVCEACGGTGRVQPGGDEQDDDEDLDDVDAL